MPFQLSKWQKRRSRGCCKWRTSVPLWGRSETNENVMLFAPGCAQGTIRFKQLSSWAVFSFPPQLHLFLSPSPLLPQHNCLQLCELVSELSCSGTRLSLWSGLDPAATESLTRTRAEIVPRAAWERCSTEADVEKSTAVTQTIAKLFSVMRCQKISRLQGDGV